MRIELLSRQHKRDAFDCGIHELNDFLQKTARQHIAKGMSRTFVLVSNNDPLTILGFFTLSGCEIITTDLPPQYARKYPSRAPAARLARLAVATKHHRKGLGTIMMVEAMRRALSAANNIGLIGFFVDAKNQQTCEYYKQYGFIALPSKPLILFLPLATLAAAVDRLHR